MSKLLKFHRTAIVNKIVESVSVPRESRLQAQESALALRMLRQRYGADVFERCRSLPEGWLLPLKGLNLDYELARVLPKSDAPSNGRYRFYGTLNVINLADYAPLPASAKYGWTLEVLGNLYDDVVAYAQARADLHEDLSLLVKQTTALLASFTTVEKLAAEWPEGYSYFPHTDLSQGAGLPAPRVADLNERIVKLREAA